MKLIEILVERLPALGGWPIDSDDERTLISSLPGVSWGLNGDGYYAFRGPNDSITYQQYEAALAASKPEWDGDGLPPVGAEVECVCNELPNELKEKLLGHILYSGEYTILKTYKTNNQHHVPVESVFKTKSWTIIPIRSEADTKKEEAVTCIMKQLLIRREVAEAFVKDISAGNIPHIRID